MLIVATYLDKSSIPNAGLGLFAKNEISRGTVVWQRTVATFKIIEREIAATLPEQAQAFLRRYATLRPDGWNLACDNARFINHAENSNLAYDHFGNVVALRKIAAGEEMTENYTSLGEIEPISDGDPELFHKP